MGRYESPMEHARLVEEEADRKRIDSAMRRVRDVLGVYGFLLSGTVTLVDVKDGRRLAYGNHLPRSVGAPFVSEEFDWQ